ncbi:hypothetical protein STEG23_006228, partial [Scotinomys teguina]
KTLTSQTKSDKAREASCSYNDWHHTGSTEVTSGEHGKVNDSVFQKQTFKMDLGVDEMAQQVKAFATTPDSTSLIPMTHGVEEDN